MLVALPPSRWRKVLGPLLVLAAGLLLCRWTWMIWPDAIIDFGRELYVPWRLFAGQHLYSEISYFNGPLSPYVNLLWLLDDTMPGSSTFGKPREETQGWLILPISGSCGRSSFWAPK